MKIQMEDIFGDYLQMNLDFDREANNRHAFINSGSRILESLLDKVKLSKIFSTSDQGLAIDNTMETIRHTTYILFFKIMYLRYLNQLIQELLDLHFKNNWKNKSIVFDVSVDKNLLDHVFGSKEDLNELFYASRILQKEDKRQRAQFSIYGEEIFPAIQLKLPDLNFKIKTYFVVAEIHSSHIQIALHQVVKLKSAQENGVSIVVQDKIIPIDHLYKTLCKILWTNISSNIVINYCKEHNKETNTLVYDFYSAQNYEHTLNSLELCVLKIVS